ncbi:MAG: RHS repeat-associated core domain-containing protein, partial [Proteobacteria bacterium]|nr:RHS repeat-associated core domain-containing protein [Pseudomonadota bacterium]
DQEYDSEAGLYNYNARMYDPAIGVFITADTIVPNFANPQNLNRYTYCNNNPLIYTDPTGHRSWSFHRVWRRFEREVRRSWDKTRAEVSRAGRRLERHVNFNVYTEGSVGFYESPSNGLFNENYAPYAYEYLDTLFLNNEVRFAMAPLYAVNDLTKQQIEIIKEILKYEQKYGTVLTAMRFSNTWGSDDNRMGEGFNNIGIPTSHGEIDLDWYTDLRSVGANEHSVLIIYPVSKLLWNKLRGLGANPYEDIKETIAVDAIFSGKLKYSDLFPDWESK